MTYYKTLDSQGHFGIGLIQNVDKTCSVYREGLGTDPINCSVLP